MTKKWRNRSAQAKKLGELRTSHFVTTYGVGSIVPVGDQSFMIAGLDRWNPRNAREIHEPRLERQLRVSRFHLPPAGEEGGDVPVVRFPEWHSCPACKRLARHDFFCGKHDSICNACKVPLVPSRFVAACQYGHIRDFPYFPWVHRGQDLSTRTGGHDMTIRTAGTSAALRDIFIECGCGASRSMEGAFGSGAFRDVTRCHGDRPWLQDSEGECDQPLRTLQRGASNVHFSIPRSALSIPPWSEVGYKLLSEAWSEVKFFVRDHREAALQMFIGKLEGPWSGHDVTAEELLELAIRRSEGEVGEEATPLSDEELRAEEFAALSRGKEDGGEQQDFIAVPTDIAGTTVERWFDKVTIVKRLREVRAIEGFTRLLPYTPGEPAARKAALFGEDPDWRLAVDVIGEGVFLTFREDALEAWESDRGVLNRAEVIGGNLDRKFEMLGVEPTQEVNPRLLLIHTIAHALIDQWSLDCGYPAASLRERLYVSESMAGLLIYTATTDSAGSLGGVIAQAESGRLATTLVRAVNSSSWCSSDPVCIESQGAGVDALNLAACHACLLLPEPSCEHSNVFLDRALIVGTPERPELGFYKDLVGGDIG